MKKVFSLLLSFIMLISTIACADVSAFAEINDTISVGETKTVTIENGGYYYYFSFTPETDGSYIFCSTGDGDTYGNLYDSEMHMLESNDDGIGFNFLIAYNFEAGKTYIFGCKYLDDSATGSFDVALTENTVTGISFTPAAEIKFVEHNNGFWDYDSNNEEFFCYHLPWFSHGDVLTVTHNNGNSVDYTYNNDNFVSENGETIDNNLFRLDSDQYSNHWTVGSDNYFTIEYMGAITRVPVTIVENPVASISFTPVSPITFFENSGGVWNTNENGEYYDYTIPWYSYGDVLTITDKDGNSVDYTFSYNEYAFVSENGEIIDGNSLKRFSEQYSNPWTVGGNNYFTVEYMGATAQVPVTIVENPVSSISFTPASPITFFENSGGVWDTNENGEYYDYTIPWFDQGDILTVTDKNGNSVDYTYNSNSDIFVSENGEIIDGNSLQRFSEQYSNPWTVGSNNYFTVGYAGATVQVPVTIVENPVASISFTPASPISFFENCGGFWRTNENGEYYEYYIPWYGQGDILTVTDKDGNSVDYTYNSESNTFVSESGESIEVSGESIEVYVLHLNSNQYESPWTIGSDNYFTIEYMGASVQVPVTIVENPVAGISFTPASPITFFENSGGYWNTNDNGEYYEYYIPWGSLGNVLTVTDKSGNSVDYTLSNYYDSDNNYLRNAFISENGELIEIYELRANSNQYLSPWTIGSENYFTIEYMGASVQVPVTIVENPAAGISFTPASPIVITENTNGYWSEIDGNEYYCYNFPWFTYGDVLTITDKNGNSTDFIYDETDCFVSTDGNSIKIEQLSFDSNQQTSPWTIGGDNYFTISIGDIVSNQIPVTIVKEQEHTHNYYAVVTDATANTQGYTTYTCDCGDSYIDDYTDFASDNSVLLAVFQQIESYSNSDFSTSTFENLRNIYDSYSYMVYGSFAQTDIDNAVFDLLTAISALEPYLNLNISAPNGAFTVAYNEEANSNIKHSLLFGTDITLTATANEGYEFVGWYDTVNNLYFSKNPEYSFKLTTNTSLRAVFVKTQSATLTFTTYSNWVQSTVTKTIDEWNTVASIDDLLPDVPYKYGYSNGRWVYDNTEVLAKLQTGENVTLIPEYDEDDTSLPTPPSPKGYTPVLDLYYKLDAEANVGSFVMAAGIPENCQLESVGVLFYYKNADELDPTKFELLINNKMLAGRFNTDEIEDIYIVNMNNMSADKNWSARGYVSYYDANGNLKTVYSNQVNIVNREQV